jgi:hypothetical protein
MNSIVVRAYSDEDIRFGFVLEGRLYTLALKKEDDIWHIFIWDPEIANEPIRILPTLDWLFQSPEMQQVLFEHNIQLCDIFFHSSMVSSMVKELRF